MGVFAIMQKCKKNMLYTGQKVRKKTLEPTLIYFLWDPHAQSRRIHTEALAAEREGHKEEAHQSDITDRGAPQVSVS